MIIMLGTGYGEKKTDFRPSLNNSLFTFLTTFISAKAVSAAESLLAVHYVHFSWFICSGKRHKNCSD